MSPNLSPSPIPGVSLTRRCTSLHSGRGGVRQRPHVEPLERRELLTTLPSGFVETQLATEIPTPTAMAVAPDGRVFVADLAGEVRVVKDGRLLSEPFATVDVLSDTEPSERGLGGVEFDPDFASNGYVYVYYTAQTPAPHSRVSRFTADPADPDRALPGSEQVIFEIDDSDSGYHRGGALHFGPDGKLYVAIGDHGRTFKAQQLTSMFGKMLRINRDGSIPEDNPFYDQATGNHRAIWALGLRNPFTFAFQPGTGTMYINDVGAQLWEEINVGAAGANYGWPSAEGPSTDRRFVAPLKSFGHTEWQCIIGAAFYNPAAAQFPAEYTGSFYFADLERKWIKRLDPSSGDVSGFAAGLRDMPVDIDVAPDGSLLYLAWPSDSRRTGGLYRISYAPDGAPGIGAQPQEVTVAPGESATFTVVASGAEPLSYQWQRDGVDIPGATGPTYTLSAASEADDGAAFRVIVSNASGSVTSSEATLTVPGGGAPTATIVSPAAGSPFSAGETLTYSGTGNDPEDGTLSAGAFTWQVDYVTGGVVRPLVPPTTGSRVGQFSIPRLTPYTATDVLYRVTLTVRDSDGLTHSTSHDLVPRTATVTLSSNVAGVKLRLDGQPVASPSYAGVVGFERLLGAPATQSINGVTYEFVSWSDGGAAEHTIFTPEADTSFTATYRALDDGSANPAESPDLTAELLRPLPASAVAGASAKARIRLTNSGPTPVAGATGVDLFISADAYLDPDDVRVGTLPRGPRLRPGASRVVTAGFAFPEAAAGSYHLLAWADAGRAVTERNEANNVSASTTPVAVGPPWRDFSAQVSKVTDAGGRRRRGVATVLLRYDGNVPVDGSLDIELRASTDAHPDAGDALLASVTKRVRMKPGASRLLRLRFLPTGRGPGANYVTAAVDTGGAFAEADETNNVVASGPALHA